MNLNPFTPAFKKLASFFVGVFDPGVTNQGTGGFYPQATGGQSAPPVNLVESESGERLSPKIALQLSAAWSCVWLNAETISTLPYTYNMRTGPNSSFGKPAVNDPLYSILGANPNSQMNNTEFWMVMVASEQLWGNGYALRSYNSVGDIISLDPMRPEFVVPFRAPTGEVRYAYNLPGSEGDYSADQIFHLKGRTMDGLVGLSRIQYARNSLGIARAADRATSDTFRNSMRAGGFVTSDKFLKKEQREQFQESLRDFTTGGRRSGGIMVLEGGMSFESLTMNPQDVQLLASRQFAIEDVCRWFGVPPVLIGHAAQGVTAWGTGIEQLLLGWQALALRPYIRRIQAAVQAQLTPIAKRSKYYLSIDMGDLLGADSAARSALYASAGQNGWMTRNEIRAQEDLPPVEGADKLTVQSNLIPIDKLGQTPAAAGAPDKPVEVEPQQKPLTGVAA